MTLNELYHHGIMGMHWGVRRYQNEDGSLTPLGIERYSKVASSESLQRSETKKAKKNLSKQYSESSEYASVAKQEELRAKTKANQLREYGKGYKDDKKALKYDEKASYWEKSGKYYTEKASVAKKLLTDIDSGKLKAGQNFITISDYDLIVLPGYVDVKKTSKIVTTNYNNKIRQILNDNQNRKVSSYNTTNSNLQNIMALQNSISNTRGFFDTQNTINTINTNMMMYQMQGMI